MRLEKSRKANNSSFLLLISPSIKLLLLVPNEEDPVFFSFVRVQIYFDILSLTDNYKRIGKVKNSHFG